MKNALAVGLIISVASVALSQSQIGQVFVDPDDEVAVPDLRDKAQRWEYKVEERAGKNPDVVEKRLNDMAKEGWELGQIDHGDGLYIFRRPLRHPLGGAPAGLIFEDGISLEPIKEDVRQF